jgi:hypothetical protein
MLKREGVCTLTPHESEHPQPTICLCFHRRRHGQPPRPRY